MSQTPGAGDKLQTSASPPPPPAQQASDKDDPMLKRVVIKKGRGERWAVTFKGPINRRDIAHLTRILRVEFLRSKRKERMKSLKNARTERITANASRS